MLAGIRKRLARKQLDIKDCEDDDKDDANAFTPPTNYIKISQGKIQLVHQSRSLESDASEAHARKDRSHCGSPTFEKELREQLENMNRVMKSKERKQMQTCRDHKVLQTRFARQESLLHAMQQENKALILRVRQYEHCLDDVMRKVVDAIVAEDNLREEVAMLKSRVRDLEGQNAALSASPAKGRDEGYCTMSSGQPQPSNGHLEDLPEEPEQWLLPAEPCSTEMEDWSMSQEELAVITLDEEREQQLLLHQNQHQQQRHYRKHNNGEHDWIWNSNDFLNSTMGEMDTVSDGITQLLQQKIVYSEDEEVACTDFTNDFYKLVNIRSSSARSLYSYIEGDTDDEDDDDEESSLSESNIRLRGAKTLTSPRLHLPSPTPSEAGRAQVTSCSSSESDELSHCTTTTTHQELQLMDKMVENISVDGVLQQQQQLPHLNGQHESDIEIEDVQLVSENHHRHSPPQTQQLQQNETHCIEEIIKTELRRSPYQLLVKSKSTLDEDEPSCILRNNQRREIESSVVRSGSVNCAIAAANSAAVIGSGCSNSAMKIQERILQKPVNSWRKSNGWKRVKSPTLQSTNSAVSPKKETKTEILRNFAATQKIQPTRIPTSIPLPTVNLQLQQHQQSLNSPKQQPPQQIRKSKIPPPVPVRRSYAS